MVRSARLPAQLGSGAHALELSHSEGFVEYERTARAVPGFALWEETAGQLRTLINARKPSDISSPVFASRSGQPLTRFGIYKIVRRRTQALEAAQPSAHHRGISPHIFRHTTAVHLLEAGGRGQRYSRWLGHASVITTNRYAEISAKTKEAALRACQPAIEASSGFR